MPSSPLASHIPKKNSNKAAQTRPLISGTEGVGRTPGPIAGNRSATYFSSQLEAPLGWDAT